MFHGANVVVNSAGRMALLSIAELGLRVDDELHRTNARGAFVVAQQGSGATRERRHVALFDEDRAMAEPINRHR